MERILSEMVILLNASTVIGQYLGRQYKLRLKRELQCKLANLNVDANMSLKLLCPRS